MKDFFLSLKEKFVGPAEEDVNLDNTEESYVELNNSAKEEKVKVMVRPFVLEDFEDIKEVLDTLREGTTITLINIKPLKEKDIIELKRAISKLRKTCQAVDGDIAGFGEDYIVATPYFAKVYRSRQKTAAEEDDSDEEQ